MKHYLESLLPRIKQYSQRLDNLALFEDQPWVQVDDSGERRVYVFRSANNELLISEKGEVRTCSWEYLEYLNSLLIKVGGSKRLYNQGFFDEAFMILKKDDAAEYMLLVNANRVADPSVEKSLERLQQKYLSSPPPGITIPASAEKATKASHEEIDVFVSIMVVIGLIVTLFAAAMLLSNPP